MLADDVSMAWRPICTCLGLGLFYTLVFMYMMSCCTMLLTYISILGVEAILVTGMVSFVSLATGHEGEDSKAKAGYWGGFAALMILFLIFNTLICCSWKRVKVAVAIIDCTADFMVDTKRLVFISLQYFIVGLVYFLFWVAACIGVIGLNEIGPMPADSGEFQAKDITWTNSNFGLLIFMFVGIIWMLSFIVGKVQFIVMSCASQYYFSSNKHRNGTSSICKASWLASMTHMGSIAFGSFLHLICIWLQMVCNMLDRMAHEAENAVTKCIICLFMCWIRCIEAWIEHLNSLAYAMIAISGDSYCKSAWNGCMLNLKHCARFMIAKSLATGFIFLGIIGVVAGNVGTCWALMVYQFPESQHVSSFKGPLAVVGFATFVTASLFLATFNDAVTATLLCFAVDVELNNGVVKFGSVSYHEKLETIFESEHQIKKKKVTDEEVNIYGGDKQGYLPVTGQDGTNHNVGGNSMT